MPESPRAPCHYSTGQHKVPVLRDNGSCCLTYSTVALNSSGVGALWPSLLVVQQQVQLPVLLGALTSENVQHTGMAQPDLQVVYDQVSLAGTCRDVETGRIAQQGMLTQSAPSQSKSAVNDKL